MRKMTSTLALNPNDDVRSSQSFLLDFQNPINGKISAFHTRPISQPPNKKSPNAKKLNFAPCQASNHTIKHLHIVTRCRSCDSVWLTSCFIFLCDITPDMVLVVLIALISFSSCRVKSPTSIASESYDGLRIFTGCRTTNKQTNMMIEIPQSDLQKLYRPDPAYLRPDLGHVPHWTRHPPQPQPPRRPLR